MRGREPVIEFRLVPEEQAETLTKPPGLGQRIRCREEHGPSASLPEPRLVLLRGRLRLAAREGQRREPDEGEDRLCLVPGFEGLALLSGLTSRAPMRFEFFKAQ